MKRTIAISANFTIEPISRSLLRLLSKLETDNDVVFAPFDQVFQQLLDPSSIFNRNNSGVNAIFMRTQGLFGNPQSGSDSYAQGRANLKELKAALASSEGAKVPLFVFLCAASADVGLDSELTTELDRAERELVSLAESNPNLHVVASHDTLSRHGIVKYDNPVGNSLAQVPYTDEYYTALGCELARRSDAVFRKPHKVLVLDCDNTLWDGVCGEDGPDGVRFPEHRLALQRFAVRQAEAGMVVCLCSKNNEPDVWEVFDRRIEMPLKRDHLVSWKINWEPKSVNLRSLATELGLGLDSFIFVDDDPAVCAEVEANCPEVCTVLLPGETDKIPQLIDHLWLFDRLKVTKEDRDRGQSYKTEVARRNAQQQSRDLEGFLESLQLVCEIGEMQSEHIARVSQLSLRTNQFNSTTKRRSETEVAQLSSDSDRHVLTVHVRDRFGDYGLVGAVTYELTNESLYADSLMLSCRALGRGVEYQMLRHLGALATAGQRAYVDIEFSRSEKNAPMANFLNDLKASGTETDGRSIYRIASEYASAAKQEQKVIAEVVDLPAERPAEVTAGQMSWKIYVDIAHEMLDRRAITPDVTRRVLDRENLSTPLVDPRSETERLLSQIWESHLGLSNFGVLDNFFEIGGDSLVAVSIFVEIEEAFKKTFPLSVLIGSPTIAGLAAHVDGVHSEITKYKYIVPIQDEGTRRPLFCMHAAGGNVLFYRDLAKELGADQPVYGLQARGVADKSETAHDRVEDMAAEYLREIRQVQLDGPYRLCGSSFGGLVAFEVAQQLKAAGEKVELLALFDTYAPGLLRGGLTKNLENPLIRLHAQFRNARKHITAVSSNRERLQLVNDRLKKLFTQLKRKALWKKNQFAIQYSKATGKELPIDLQRNHKAIDKALESYEAVLYDGHLTLFRAKDQPAALAQDRHLGWETLTTKPITVIDVKGSHGAVTVYPFASDLAEKLTPFLVGEVANKVRHQQESSRLAAVA